MKGIFCRVELKVMREAGGTVNLRDMLESEGAFNRAQETFWITTYDAAAEIRSLVEVAVGSYNKVEVPFAALFSALWATGCDRFQVIHNHPASRNVKPTKTDEELTERINIAAAISGVFLEDHIVIGPPDQWWSMQEHGQFVPSPAITNLYAAGQRVWTHKERRCTRSS